MARKLLKAKEAAEILGLVANTLWKKAAADPTFPRPIKLSARCTRWDEAEVIAWIDSKRVAA